MKKILLTVLASGTACLALTSVPAFAVMPITSGWYFEANGGTSRQQDTSNNGRLSSNMTGLGGSGNIGYKFMPYVGVEAGYTQYSLERLELNNVTVLKNRPYDYHAAVKGIIPIGNSGFEPFAKIGYARVKTKYQVIDPALLAVSNATASNASSSGVYLGVGAEYYFMQEFAVIVQWARAKGNGSVTGEMDLYSIGASFIFN